MSPLAAASRKRSGSRASSAAPAMPKPSPPPPPGPMGQITRVKRKYYVEEQEAEEAEEETPPPKKRSKLQEMQYKEKLIKSVEEATVRRLEAERRERQALIPPYPAPTAERPHGAFHALPLDQQRIQYQAPARGFFSRLFDTISPFKRRETSTSALSQEARVEAAAGVAPAAPQLDHEREQQLMRSQQLGGKRKRTADEVTGLPVIAESPEPVSGTMQTPARGPSSSGLVPRSLPKPRRTYREARAARARNANDPPTPAVPRINRTAPSTPLDKKNDYERIRRLREMQVLQDQQKALEEKLAKLRAEQEAEMESQPRKTKRVKLDHLKFIPHNLPGESSGCFRVPEGDSEDEMEVDESAELIDNTFTPEPSRPASPVKTTAVPATPAVDPTPAGNLFKTPAAPASAFRSTQPAKPFTSLNQETPKSTPATSLFKLPAVPATEPTNPSQATSPLKKVSATPAPARKPAALYTEQSVQQPTSDNTTTPPTPQLVADDDSDSDYHTDAEDWPELPQRKPNEPEAPQWYKDEAYAIFTKGFEHWKKTGEVLPL